MTETPDAPRPTVRPPLSSLPANDVKEFRARLKDALARELDGSAVGSSKWGVYAFYDYDGEPIYVGQTKERLDVRIRRHLTNQRTDAVAMRILDPFEVAEVEMWPLPDLDNMPKGDAGKELDAYEYSAYLRAIAASKFKAILNEKIPPRSFIKPLPTSLRVDLTTPEIREERGHPDIRIARRAETLARLSAVARERGEVTPGLRRVIVIQAVRLAYLAASRLAQASGEPQPSPGAVDLQSLIGSVLYESDDDPADNDESMIADGE